MQIEQLLKQITDTCKLHMQAGDWSKNEAMRYAYVTLGKQLSKSARFFFSLEGKYGQCGLSVEEMKNIHFANAGYEVTCYVSAKMLKDIFSELGIKSNILQSTSARPYTLNGETLDIYHSYLLCEGDNNKKYFMSINSDLVNLKYNFKTEHFAGDVPYVYNGVQTYQGEEIAYSKLSPEELLAIDKKVGYAFPVTEKGVTKYIYANNDPVHDYFGRQRRAEELFLMDNISSLDRNFTSDIGKMFSKFKRDDGSPKTNYTELTTDERRKVEWYIYKKSMNLIKRIMHIDPDDDIFAKEIPELFKQNDLDFKQIQNKTKELIFKYQKPSDTQASIDHSKNPFMITSTALQLVRAIENFNNPELSKTENDKTKLFEHYQELHKKVAVLFVNSDTVKNYTGDKHARNSFLIKKIMLSIEKDFECETSASCGYLPEFCTNLGLVEQATFLKTYLRTILKPELPTDSDFNKRILFSTISELSNPENHAFLMHVKNEENSRRNELLYSLIYNPKTNQINLFSFPKLRAKYKILSKTVMNHFNNTQSVQPNKINQSAQPTGIQPGE